jgi:TonB family protein
LVRKAGIEGRVEVTFTLDASGNAENPRVTQSLHRALDAQALHSVKNTTFVSEETKTGKLAGKMISVQFAYRQPGSPS